MGAEAEQIRAKFAEAERNLAKAEAERIQREDAAFAAKQARTRPHAPKQVQLTMGRKFTMLLDKGCGEKLQTYSAPKLGAGSRCGFSLQRQVGDTLILWSIFYNGTEHERYTVTSIRKEGNPLESLQIYDGSTPVGSLTFFFGRRRLHRLARGIPGVPRFGGDC